MSKAETAIDGVRVRLALDAVRAQIARALADSTRQATDITIVAVTKGFGAEAINAAFAAGLTDIGENYFQEAAAKFPQAAWPLFPVRRHFIGRVQRNKARRIASLFDVVQTVEDAAVAAGLDAGAAASGKVLDVLIQANVAADDRQGVSAQQIPQLAAQLAAFKHLRLRGLMAIGPQDSGKAAEAFSRACVLYETLQQSNPDIRMLSIGMSGDIDAAVRAGATTLRLGTALFGQRPNKSVNHQSQTASMREG
ncbi:MAG: YggS family pyridoxal phosphate-dependent enzyme [Candidatus Eremiobacteraeota bacterium]|nr:YggS family pyridoxal phosphate-dependent enzyme [Candidatus Eremiobacteraeota bacterium]